MNGLRARALRASNVNVLKLQPLKRLAAVNQKNLKSFLAAAVGASNVNVLKLQPLSVWRQSTKKI